jgi:predicted TIM-barrel fold metal-dependent hydrolase
MLKNAPGMQMPTNKLSEHIAEVELFDHHTHGVWIKTPTEEMFTFQMTESDRQPESLEQGMEAQLGFAIRAWCAPILDLPAHADSRTYFDRRCELGGEEVNRRFLRSAGISVLGIDTGYRGDEIFTEAGMAEISGRTAYKITRLETVAEIVLLEGTTAQGFIQDYRSKLTSEAKGAIGLKSIIAYRYGLDFDPARPSEQEVQAAAAELVAEFEKSGSVRVADPVLLRHFLYEGMDLNLPIQFHVGYGDPDLQLHRCDPLLMTEFIKIAEQRNIPLLLLHCYPFHRNAGYLAQMFKNVYLDVGLAINYTGAQSSQIIAESFELAPFNKILFSSDAWGLSDLTYLGAKLFRVEVDRLFSRWVNEGHWSEEDAIRVVDLVAYENARQVYQTH